MSDLDVRIDGDNWPDLKDRKIIDCMGNNQPVRIALVRGGMLSGRSSVVIRIDLPDGSTVMAETSLALFLFAAKTLEIGNERENMKN